MNDAIRRGLRTFLQAFVGSLVLQLGALLASPGTLPDWSVLKTIVISAAVAGVVALLSFAQNALEDGGQIPSLLKAPASPGANPVPDPGVGNRVERHDDPSPGG